MTIETGSFVVDVEKTVGFLDEGFPRDGEAREPDEKTPEAPLHSVAEWREPYGLHPERMTLVKSGFPSYRGKALKL